MENIREFYFDKKSYALTVTPLDIQVKIRKSKVAILKIN